MKYEYTKTKLKLNCYNIRYYMFTEREKFIAHVSSMIELFDFSRNQGIDVPMTDQIKQIDSDRNEYFSEISTENMMQIVLDCYEVRGNYLKQLEKETPDMESNLDLGDVVSQHKFNLDAQSISDNNSKNDEDA